MPSPTTRLLTGLASSSTAMSGESSRRAEIEAKRAKLAQLRRAREERNQQLHAPADAPPADAPPASAPATTRRQELDELVTSLIGARGAAGRATPTDAPPAPAPEAPRTAPAEPAPSARTEPEPEPAPSAVQAEARAPIPPAPQPAPDTQPRVEKVLYTKEVQTDAPREEDTEEPQPQDTHPSTEPAPEAAPEAAPKPAEPAAPPRGALLEPEEAGHVAQSADYADFLYTQSKVIERALDEPYDVLKDYTYVPGSVEGDSDEHTVQLLHTMVGGPAFETRAVTDVDWSAKHPELLAVSYSRKRTPTTHGDQDGVVAVWNMHVRDRPEFVFQAPSDVVSVLASPFHPHLFIGGTYSGEVLLWDTRHRRLPVQRSPLAFSTQGSGHCAPVTTLRLLGSAQAHQLVSISSDGHMCSWSLDMLSKPHESLTLTNPLHPRSADVGVSSADFPAHDASRFCVGTDEGNVFSALRYDRAGSRAGLDLRHVLVGHSAPVTSVAFHPAGGAAGRRPPVDFSDVVLTGSMDWTTALWRVPTDAAPSRARTEGYYYPHADPRIATSTRTNPLAFRAGDASWASVSPLLRFENQQDYVMDVQWHPQHPAVFAQVDAAGKLDVYNIAASTERPQLSARSPSGRAFNRVAWERRSGDTHVCTKLAVGGVDGRVYVYGVPETLAMPRGDADWYDMQAALAAAGNRS